MINNVQILRYMSNFVLHFVILNFLKNSKILHVQNQFDNVTGFFFWFLVTVKKLLGK